MKVDIETLKKTKGIGSKTLEKIIEQHNADNEVKMFKSEYNEDNGIDLSKPINLINGDMIEELNRVPDKSIDLILTDLPYGTTANKWDNIIPFTPLWRHYERVIKDDGVIVLFGNEPFTSRVISSNYELYRYSWIWKKDSPTGFLNSSYRPLQETEDIMVFSKSTVGSLSTNPIRYNPQGVIPVNKVKKNNPNSTWRVNKGYDSLNNKLNSDEEYVQKYTNHPTNIIEFKRDKNAMHPTQKPVELLKYLIKTYTKEGDLVLDSTMGSGSTGVAALKTNRRFIGVELDEEYFNIAEKRILE